MDAFESRGGGRELSLTPSPFWRHRKVCVTGATGLLGGWLIKDLVDQGADVIALVRDSPRHSMFWSECLADQVTIVNGAVGDLALLRRALAEHKVQVVFHLAAQSIVGIAKQDPVGTLESNVRGTWNLLEASRLANVEQIVVASSEKAYGPSDQLPCVETHRLCGRYPYDVSKSCTDLIAQMYATTYATPVAIARCGNLFGGGDLQLSRTIPGVIFATLNNERFAIRSDGTYVRDFLYVKDASRAYLLLAEKLASNSGLCGEAFNFSLGVKLTVLEIVQQVLRFMGRSDLQPIVQNLAKAEIVEQFLSPEKARMILGWQPLYTLEQALLETIDWYTKHYSQPLTRVAAATRD